MKRFYKIFASWFLCLFLVLSQFIVSFADVGSLMIGSSSNALMTLELDDSDYTIMPMSSMGTVSNTLTSNETRFYVRYKKPDGAYANASFEALKVNGRYSFNYTVPDGCIIDYFTIDLYKDDLPTSGSYKFSFDLASDFSFDYRSSPYVYYSQSFVNAASVSGYVRPEVETFSGDVYIPPYALDLGNVRMISIVFEVPSSAKLAMIGGSFSIHFEKTNESGEHVGYDSSSQDYQDDVSSSLSDLSSSVDSMTEDLSSAAENLEYISTSQNLIIQGIDNVVMHISDQLFAFWDQLFNLIHVPTMAKMDDIISAIQNMDLEIEVNLDGLKSTINNMSTAVQNKLQSTTDQITDGYDNTGITQENEKLEQSINQYDEVESGIFEDAEGFIGDFEYPSVDSLPLGIIKALAFVGSFLQGVFLSMGDFSVIITFSLTMIFVMVVVGYHRIRS